MPVLLVDGSSVGWRAYHAMASANLSSKGFPTGMIFGFLRLIRDGIYKTGSTQCKVAWDGGSAAFRTALFPDYRKHDDATDPEIQKRRAEFRMQRTWLNDKLQLFGIGSWYCHGWEADDLLGLWTTGKDEYVVMSGDKDMRQLVSKKVSVLPPDSNLISAETFEQMTGIPTSTQYFWYRVLTGDPSDKIPGVGKIGDVRGKKLVLDGWPKSTKVELTEQQMANVERNYQLMHIPNAARQLKEAITAKQVQVVGFNPMKDLLKAKIELQRIEMEKLLDYWGEWAQPFRLLKDR